METENSLKQAVSNIAVFLAKLSTVGIHNRTYTINYTQCTKERERMETDRKRGALELLEKLEQGAAVRPTAGETPGGKLDRLIAELNTAYKASVAAHFQWRAALEEKARAATPTDREQWEQLAAARRTVWTAKHQNAMNHIDRLREYSPIAADEWKPPKD